MVAMQQPATEVELLRRWQAGEPAAWSEILRAYKPLLMAIAFGIVRNQQDAEEVVHDALLSSQRAIGGFRGDCKLASWLGKVARNRALNRYLYWARRGRLQSEDIYEPAIANQLVDGRPHPRAAAERAEFEDACRKGIEAVSPRHREMLEFRAAGVSYEEIGARTGMELGTVKSRISRARQELRERMGL